MVGPSTFGLTQATLVNIVIMTILWEVLVSTKSLSIAEVKATLSEQIRSVEHGDPVVITRHGKAVAALVPAEDLEALQRLRARGPEGGLASIAGGWDDSEELVSILEQSERVGRRATPSLD
ncbi:MAG: type II toxin-antitoxin system Phd/YefM family antitoxin [Longimicrobiales bacterium]|nr:type II toxin-antitoxin system Phd/YefM family antitoxin [Longimicrobiales bacterium]